MINFDPDSGDLRRPLQIRIWQLILHANHRTDTRDEGILLIEYDVLLP